MFLLFLFEHLMTIYTAPGWYVAQCTRIGAGNSDSGTTHLFFEAILQADNRHWAQQPTSVQLDDIGHTITQPGLICSAVSGLTWMVCES